MKAQIYEITVTGIFVSDDGTDPDTCDFEAILQDYVFQATAEVETRPCVPQPPIPDPKTGGEK